MERQKFENEFREAFRNAGKDPSSNVWVSLELELERAEGKKMKRRVFFYQMLAAASVSFAILVAGAGYMAFQNNQPANAIAQIEQAGPVAENANLDSSERSIQDLSETNGDHLGGARESNRSKDKFRSNSTLSESSEIPSAHHLPKTTTQLGGERKRSEAVSGTQNSTEGSMLAVRTVDHADAPKTESSDHHLNSNFSSVFDNKTNRNTLAKREELPPILQQKEYSPVFSSKQEVPEADPVALMLLKLNDLEKELASQGTGKKKDKNSQNRETLWTSVGFAAGGYNGQASAASPVNTMAMNNAVQNQSKASGVAYSVGLSMGTRITDRLVLQGGLNYLTNSSNYTSNQVVRAENLKDFKPATISDLRAAESSLFANSMVIPTAPHTVNSNIEFISLPVQAGYLVIDRKFGLQFNAGVSTDFFLQNTINPEGSDLQKTTQERGADSPYRSTNFSGLMSTEFTYRLGSHYRLALNPGLRYPLNSIYKDETGIDSTPLTFDVGLRFRYIFR